MIIDIDLREELAELLKDYGVNAIYQKTSRLMKCKCVDPLYKSPDVNCKICNGSGKLVKMVKVKMIVSEQWPPNRKNLIGESQIGDISTPYINFFIPNTIVPYTKDVIYLVGWVKGKAVNIKGVYEIKGYQGFRGENGRIEFYYITAMYRPDMIDRGQKYIDKLRGKK